LTGTTRHRTRTRGELRGRLAEPTLLRLLGLLGRLLRGLAVTRLRRLTVALWLPVSRLLRLTGGVLVVALSEALTLLRLVAAVLLVALAVCRLRHAFFLLSAS